MYSAITVLGAVLLRMYMLESKGHTGWLSFTSPTMIVSCGKVSEMLVERTITEDLL